MKKRKLVVDVPSPPCSLSTAMALARSPTPAWHVSDPNPSPASVELARARVIWPGDKFKSSPSPFPQRGEPLLSSEQCRRDARSAASVRQDALLPPSVFARYMFPPHSIPADFISSGFRHCYPFLNAVLSGIEANSGLDGKPGIKQGQFMKAVMESGPLLQQLLLFSPLPPTGDVPKPNSGSNDAEPLVPCEKKENFAASESTHESTADEACSLKPVPIGDSDSVKSSPCDQSCKRTPVLKKSSILCSVKPFHSVFCDPCTLLLAGTDHTPIPLSSLNTFIQFLHELSSSWRFP